MKVTMNVDITPEEVRKLFGLPDVEGFQNQLMDDLRARMQEGVEGYDPMKLFQPYVTGGMAGWDVFQRLVSGAGVTSTQGEDKPEIK